MLSNQTKTRIYNRGVRVRNVKTADPWFDHFELEVYDGATRVKTMNLSGAYDATTKNYVSSSVLVDGLELGKTYGYRTRVIPKGGGTPGAWTALQYDTAGDTTPAAATFATVVSPNIGGAAVKFTITSNDADLDFCEAIQTTSGTPPATATRGEAIPYDGIVDFLHPDPVSNWYMYVYARTVDKSGNLGAWQLAANYQCGTADNIRPGSVYRIPGTSLINNFSVTGDIYTGWPTKFGLGTWSYSVTNQPGPNGETRRCLTALSNQESTYLSEKIPCDPTQTYRFALSIWDDTATTTGRYFGFYCLDKDGNELAVKRYNASTRAYIDTITNPYFWYGYSGGVWLDQIAFVGGAFSSVSNIPSGKGPMFFFQLPANAAFLQFRFLNYSFNGSTVRAHFFSPSISVVDGVGDLDGLAESASRRTRKAVHTSAFPTTNPLSATSNTTSSTIRCASFIMRCGDIDVPVSPANGSGITGLTANQRYYIYYDDQNFAGGAVTLQATTDVNVLKAASGRFTVGDLLTPPLTTGGGGATSVYRPTTYSDTGTNATVDPTGAYDGDANTSSATVSNYYDGTDIYSGSCTWSGIPKFSATPATATLKIKAEGYKSGTVPGFSLKYSLNGGSTYTTLASSSFGVQTFSVALTTAQDLSLLRVMANVTGIAYSIEPSFIDVYEVWVETT